MDRTGFENLEIYQLSERIADTVWAIAMAWRHSVRVTVGFQLIRAADSIGANLAEGYGRETYGDRRHYVHMARGSFYETKHWLRRAYHRQLLQNEQIQALKPMLDELGPRLNAYLNSIGRRKRDANPQPPPASPNSPPTTSNLQGIP